MTTGYITIDEFASTISGSVVSNINAEFASACIEAASRQIDGYCGRTFLTTVAASDSATTRVFRSVSPYRCYIDDCWQTPTLVETDDGDAGTFTGDWASSDWVAEPQNGIGPNLQSGWPYTTIVAVLGRTFPCIIRPNNVRVTAKWGWAAAPSNVKMACRRLAHRMYELPKAPFGASGTPDIGYIRIHEDSIACGWLEDFVRKPILIG